MGLVQNNVLSMTYGKTCKKGHFSKNIFSCNSSKTFMNKMAKYHSKHNLQLIKNSHNFKLTRNITVNKLDLHSELLKNLQ